VSRALTRAVYVALPLNFQLTHPNCHQEVTERDNVSAHSVSLRQSSNVPKVLPLYLTVLVFPFFSCHKSEFILLPFATECPFQSGVSPCPLPPQRFARIPAHHIGRCVSVSAILFLPLCGAQSSAVPDNLITIMGTCDRL
jgi:hypothetical protein